MEKCIINILHEESFKFDFDFLILYSECILDLF